MTRCLHNNFTCDGVVDCLYGVDEQNCSMQPFLPNIHNLVLEGQLRKSFSIILSQISRVLPKISCVTTWSSAFPCQKSAMAGQIVSTSQMNTFVVSAWRHSAYAILFHCCDYVNKRVFELFYFSDSELQQRPLLPVRRRKVHSSIVPVRWQVWLWTDRLQRRAWLPRWENNNNKSKTILTCVWNPCTSDVIM